MKKRLNKKNLIKSYGKKNNLLSKVTKINSITEERYNKNLVNYLEKFLQFSNEPSWNKNNSFMNT